MKKIGDVMTYAEFKVYVDWLFWVCVDLLKVWGDWTSLGYNLLNTLIKINAVRGDFKLPITYGKIKLQRGDNRVRKSAIE